MRISLLFPLKPEPDESLIGFVSRSLAWNHIEGMAQFLRHAGCEFGARASLATTLAENIDLIAPFLGVDRSVLHALAPRPVADDPRLVQFRGGRLKPHSLNQARRRISPTALRTSPYQRAMWLLGPLEWCTETWDQLIDHCPSCEQPLGWGNPRGIDICTSCGFDLKRATVPFAPDDVRGPLIFLGALFEVDEVKRGRMLRHLQDPFDKLDPGSILELAHRLGRASADEDEQDPHDLIERTRQLARGARLILGHPDGIDQIARAGQGENALTPAFFRRLRIADYQHALPGVQLVAEKIIKRWEPLPSGVQRLRVTRTLNRRLTKTEAAQWLGLERGILRQVIAAGHLTPGPTRGSAREHVWLQTDEVVKLKQRLIRRVSYASFAAELGLGGSIVEAMVAGKLLEPSTDPLIELAYRAPHLNEARAEEVRRRLRACLTDQVPPSDHLPLRQAIRAAGDQDFLWVKLFQTALEGRLDVRIWSYGQSLRVEDWQVSPADYRLLATTADLHDAPFGGIKRDLSRAEVERLLFCGPNGVSALVRNGRITALPSGKHRFSRADALAYRTLHVSTLEMAARCGLTAGQVLVETRKLGMKKREVGFFLRSEFEAHLQAFFEAGARTGDLQWPRYRVRRLGDVAAPSLPPQRYQSEDGAWA